RYSRRSGIASADQRDREERAPGGKAGEDPELDPLELRIALGWLINDPLAHADRGEIVRGVRRTAGHRGRPNALHEAIHLSGVDRSILSVDILRVQDPCAGGIA